MWFSKMIEWLASLETRQGIRGKWRIQDGKEGEWSDLKFKAPRW
jgi:hypothetical protein